MAVSPWTSGDLNSQEWQLEVACFTIKLHALGAGRFELPTKELKAPCSTIELYALCSRSPIG
jgi:hypothetical protein